MADLPTGTVTFLLTDIEGSTALWERQPAAMQSAAARHDALIEAAVAEHGGLIVRPRGEGDSRFVVFSRASDAVAAALALQWDLTAEPWPTSTPLRVRVALHTGEPELRDGDYYGTAVNRCARLRSVAHGGQVLVSQATVELVGDRVPPPATLLDLGEHRLRDLMRTEHIYQLVQPGVPVDCPPLRSLDTLPNNLPRQVTSFVGREQEQAEVERLLGTTALLTLTGAGGCGKTRLALQVAAEVLDAYPDGVWFIDLAPLTDPALVPRAVASALGVREQPGQPLLTTLLAWLRTRRLLLVLDNCEHLLDASATLVEAVLRAGPDVTILATSRELLGVAGETAWRVPSLAAPERQEPVAAHRLFDYAAVRLFAERAVAVRTDFAVTEQNAAAVAQVCRRLDGIPLALELAAARLTALTVEQVAARLDDRFRLLTGGRRTAMRRQQTLEAAIDWSHDLLSAPEQGLLRRLAVFAGGWTLEAAEAVGSGDGLAPAAVLDLLARLVEKSLVLAEEADGEDRYRLLETVRQYAAAKLLAAGEATAVRDRHRDWYLTQVECAEANMWGSAGNSWLDRLEVEHDNLRAALDWSLADPAGGEAGLRLAGAARVLWVNHDHVSEGRRWLEALLAANPTSSAARAKALVAAGFLANHWDHNERADAYLPEGLALYQRLGDQEGSANALGVLGRVARIRGDYARATALLNQGLVLARATRHTQNIINVQFEVGRLALHQGEYALAEACLSESLTLCRDEGVVLRMASVQTFLGIALAGRGERRRATALLEEGLARARAQGFQRGVSQALHGLGLVAWSQGEVARARLMLRESLRLRQDLHYHEGIAECLEALAIIAKDASGGPRPAVLARAVTLLAAAAALRATIGAPLPPADRLNVDATLAAARALLSADAVATTWAAGQALTQEEAIAEALSEEGG